MEGLRSKMVIFRYQLLHIGMGKSSLSKSLKTLRPEYERYMRLAKAIKETSRERKDLLAQKKETPVWKIPMQMDLSRRIAELTEKLEELRSEKAMLLSTLEYPEDTGTDAIRKDISTMETGLQKLEQQEEKYSAELKNALDEYKGLQEQAAEFDPVELYRAREVLCPTKEASAVSRVQSAYGDKYNPWLMFDRQQTGCFRNAGR